jgi:hypothetical protein
MAVALGDQHGFTRRVLLIKETPDVGRVRAAVAGPELQPQPQPFLSIARPNRPD